MNESAPFGASATASTRSTARRKRRWMPPIIRVSFWRALLEYSFIGGLLNLLAYSIMWRGHFGWGLVLSFIPSFVVAMYAWRLAPGTGRRRRRVARVLVWVALVSTTQGLLEWQLWRWVPESVTFLGQPANNPPVSVWQTLWTSAFVTLLFFGLARTVIDLFSAGRQQLRWRLTFSYIVVSIAAVIMIPFAFILIAVVFVIIAAPSVPQLMATPQEAATALTPLVQRGASPAELSATLQGMRDGSVRFPEKPITLSIDTNAERPPDAEDAPLNMQLAGTARLILLRPDNIVLASSGTDAPAPGSRLPNEEVTQLALLIEDVRDGGCREGTAPNGLGADRAVCAITDEGGAVQALLVAQAPTLAGTTAPGSFNAAQLTLVVAFGAVVVILLSAFSLVVILPVAGGGVGYLLAGRLTKRLERLTAAAGDIAQGNLERRVEIDSEDEVGRLANDFNTMAAKLAEREHALAEAAQRAERLLRANKRLVADVSHELRTPLTTVRGYLEALAHEHGDKLPQRDMQVIESELQRLTALINDLFTLARTEAQQLPLQIAPTDAHALTTKLVGALAPLARRERQIELIAALPTELPLVCADQTRLEQVLQNLIQNALRYTPAGGIVALEATATNDHVTLAVADTGMGIAPDELSHVWERFYRSDRSRARETGGAGLGLALVKELVTAMGGSVSAESTLGRGSKFSITLRQADGDPVTR